MHKQRKRLLALLAVLLGASIIVGSVLLYRQLRPYESNQIAMVSWSEGGTPYSVQVTVLSANGTPVAGANVHIHNNSGGNDATTDANGLAVVQVSEPEVTRIDVGNKSVLSREYLGEPNVSRGLTVHVQMKK
jgi:hypothetical protein